MSELPDGPSIIIANELFDALPIHQAVRAADGWHERMVGISADGKLSDVCIGTSYADDYIYYYHRPATDDMHGYGPVLLAGSEMIRLMKNEKFNIKSSESGPTMISEKK